MYSSNSHSASALERIFPSGLQSSDIVRTWEPAARPARTTDDMKESQAIIERVRQINPTHQQLHLTVEPSLSNLRPGQTGPARSGGRWDPYLREQWWPVGIGNNRLVVERPVSEA